MKPKSWYYRPTAGHDKHGQGVIACEETGRSVAVAYDGDSDGALLAAAPELNESAQYALDNLEAMMRDHVIKASKSTMAQLGETCKLLRSALSKARGE